VSVDTYIGSRNTRNYHAVQRDGVEVLVSNALAPHVRSIHMEVKRFLFMSSLKAELELQNGLVLATS
jgi:hypothetical protein